MHDKESNPLKVGGDRDLLAERAVIGTILGDALLTATRREAQKNASRARFGVPAISS